MDCAESIDTCIKKTSVCQYGSDCELSPPIETYEDGWSDEVHDIYYVAKNEIHPYGLTKIQQERIKAHGDVCWNKKCVVSNKPCQGKDGEWETGCLTPEHIDYDCVGDVVICSGKEMSDEDECNKHNGKEDKCNEDNKCQVLYEGTCNYRNFEGDGNYSTPAKCYYATKDKDNREGRGLDCRPIHEFPTIPDCNGKDEGSIAATISLNDPTNQMLHASDYRKLMHREGAFNNYNYDVCSVLGDNCMDPNYSDNLCGWAGDKCLPNKGGYKTSTGDFSYIPLKNDSDTASVCPFFRYDDHDCDGITDKKKCDDDIKCEWIAGLNNKCRPKFYAQKTCKGLPEMNVYDKYSNTGEEPEEEKNKIHYPFKINKDTSIHEYNRYFSNVFGPTFMFNYAKRGHDCRRTDHRAGFDFYALNENHAPSNLKCATGHNFPDAFEKGGTWYNTRLLNKLTSKIYDKMSGENSFVKEDNFSKASLSKFHGEDWRRIGLRKHKRRVIRPASLGGKQCPPTSKMFIYKPVVRDYCISSWHGWNGDKTFGRKQFNTNWAVERDKQCNDNNRHRMSSPKTHVDSGKSTYSYILESNKNAGSAGQNNWKMWRKPDGYSSNSLTIKNNEDDKYKIEKYKDSDNKEENKHKVDLKDSYGATIGYDGDNVEVLCYQEPQEDGGWVEDKLNEIENYSWFHDENPVINKYFICDTNDKHYIRRKNKTIQLAGKTDNDFSNKCYNYEECETSDYKNIWNALNLNECNTAETTCVNSLNKILEEDDDYKEVETLTDENPTVSNEVINAVKKLFGCFVDKPGAVYTINQLNNITQENILKQVRGIHPNTIDKSRNIRKSNWFSTDELLNGVKGVENLAYGHNSETFKGSLLHCLGTDGAECDDTSGPRLTKVEYEEGTKDITLHFNEEITIDESNKKLSEMKNNDITMDFVIPDKQIKKIIFTQSSKKIMLQLVNDIKKEDTGMEVEYKKSSIIIKDLSGNEMSTFKRKITKKINL